MLVDIFVYGAEQICASCVGLPSSKDTYEWLEAAIGRKYPEQAFNIHYIDIFNPPENKDHKQFAARVVEEEFVYPVIVMDNKVVGEGNPRLKDIYAVMEKKGYG